MPVWAVGRERLRPLGEPLNYKRYNIDHGQEETRDGEGNPSQENRYNVHDPFLRCDYFMYGRTPQYRAHSQICPTHREVWISISVRVFSSREESEHHARILPRLPSSGPSHQRRGNLNCEDLETEEFVAGKADVRW